MTASLISLISILIGIIGSNVTGFIFKKYSLGFTGNTISGVFGSIFLIKLLGRLGLSPKFILQSGTINYFLLANNFIVSLLGGIIAVFFAFKLKTILNNLR